MTANGRRLSAGCTGTHARRGVPRNLPTMYACLVMDTSRGTRPPMLYAASVAQKRGPQIEDKPCIELVSHSVKSAPATRMGRRLDARFCLGS